ncbi:MAG: potassium-transporting ATPase subunit KdpC [Agathobaculum desmolans]|uniref:potassium-transporting ATPase subunit KdpC n=1 Tax=Agathobaculum desmolans TaxID=39484 RepID=UPI00399598E0
MNETTNKNAFFHDLRQSLVVTLILLLLCGLVFPILLSGISALIFPSQANGSLVYADGQAVGAENIGQDFTEPYFMKGRPSAYNYNTYYEDDQGNQYYNDGSEFAGLSSGSNNYAPSNPALTERVEADIEAFLEANPDVKREDIPADLMTASGSGLDPHISPESARIQIPALAAASGLSKDKLEQIVADNTEGKLFGIFGEETVNVLGVNLDIAKAMGLVVDASK